MKLTRTERTSAAFLAVSVMLLFLARFYPMHVYLPAFFFFYLAPLAAITLLWIELVRMRKRYGGIALASLALILTAAFNPPLQGLLVESRNRALAQALHDRAVRESLKGKTADQVKHLLGNPTKITVTASAVSPSTGQRLDREHEYTVLSYVPLPFYWTSSSLDVVIEDGRVTYFEIDD